MPRVGARFEHVLGTVGTSSLVGLACLQTLNLWSSCHHCYSPHAWHLFRCQTDLWRFAQFTCLALLRTHGIYPFQSPGGSNCADSEQISSEFERLSSNWSLLQIACSVFSLVGSAVLFEGLEEELIVDVHLRHSDSFLVGYSIFPNFIEC